MRRIIFLISVMILWCMPFNLKARTIKDIFVSEPGYLMPLLSKGAKMDMIDYLSVGQMAEVNNSLGKGTHFNKVTDNYMSVQISNSSTVELLLMPVSKRDTIIVAVTTFSLPAKDSRIEFFTTDWRRYVRTKSFIKEPTMKDFISIPKGDKTKKETVLAAIDFPIIQYRINPDNNTIIATHGLKECMSKDDYEKIAPYLRDDLEYRFKNGVFSTSKFPIDWTTVLLSATGSIAASLITCLF